MAKSLSAVDSGCAPTVPKVSYAFAQRFGVLMGTDGENLSVTYRDDTPVSALQEVRRLTRLPIAFERLDNEAFNTALADAYHTGSAQAIETMEEASDLHALLQSVPQSEDLLAQEDDAPIIRLINAILAEAVQSDASDVHIETFEARVLVRFRIDGVLREVIQPQRGLAQLLVSRIKVMAKMDIAEKRVPQDGRLSVKVAGRDVDVRVSTIPTRHGERVVMRLLDRSANQLSLDGLGLTPSALTHLTNLVAKPHGIILVTGPTGSGKTTTLYAALAQLNDGQKNILTVEDPVEYDLEGVGQTQVNAKADMTFSRGLRAILRQDPDVVMIGEIRDKETAEIAIQASLTGHMVLSTLHTNTAIGAITRLIDMGIEPFLLSSSLTAVVAQRLVRKLCPACKQETVASPARLKEVGMAQSEQDEQTEKAEKTEPVVVYQAGGCEACHHSGYAGRLGIYEVIAIDDVLKDLIHERAAERQLLQHAYTLTTSIRRDGWQRVLDGVTSVEELMRVTHAG